VKLARGLAALTVVATLAACGQSAGDTKTVTTTVTRTTTTAAADTTPAKKRPTKPVAAKKKARAATGTWTACDANIEARRPHTSCGFAQNAFYEYWVSDEATSLRVHSPALGATLVTRCSTGSTKVTCRTGDGGRVRFARSALDAYSANQASTYASTHDVGADTTSGLSAGANRLSEADAQVDDSSSDDEYPPLDERIPSFDEGTGSVVQCADGMYSQSGGRPGSCSGHGGVDG
jgi:hypothetical protein